MSINKIEQKTRPSANKSEDFGGLKGNDDG